MRPENRAPFGQPARILVLLLLPTPTYLSLSDEQRKGSLPLFPFSSMETISEFVLCTRRRRGPACPSSLLRLCVYTYTNQLCVRPVIYQQAGKRAVGKPSFPPPPSFTFHIKNGPEAPRERENQCLTWSGQAGHGPWDMKCCGRARVHRTYTYRAFGTTLHEGSAFDAATSECSRVCTFCTRGSAPQTRRGRRRIITRHIRLEKGGGSGALFFSC